MDKIKGLSEYVKRKEYRKALNLPTEQIEDYKMLAQGECNINYIFTHPITKKKLLLRVNIISQMHLKDQIGYEYNALKILEKSNRTPKALFVDGTKKYLDFGIMVMEYLEGRPLNYKSDMKIAMEILADIHSLRINENMGLIKPENPLNAILIECEEMVKKYFESPLSNDKKKKLIRKLLDKGHEKVENNNLTSPYYTIVNTELNSTNFLINGEGKKNYLIDWEKPLFSDPAQDLGHLLCPTTTFWKTDVRFKEKEMEEFLDYYIKAVGDRFDTKDIKERTNLYLAITCLRGLTWCMMAWVDYKDPNKLIVNQSTLKKLEDYLSDDFLNEIDNFFNNKI